MEYINLNHLRSFYFVAKERSISKAASKLFVQQPALSKTIKKLEESLGVDLLYREGRGINLTSEGEAIFGKCEEIFSQVASIENFSNRTDLKLTDSFHINTNDALSSLVLPKIIENIKDDYSHVRPSIFIEGVEQAYTKLQKKKIDLGLFFYAPKIPTDLRLVKKIPIRYKLVISKAMFHSHRIRSQFIGSREAENPQEIKYPTVELLRKENPDTQIHFSSNSLLAHKQMVLNGMGVSILPEFLVREELAQGKLKELLPEEDFIFTLKIIARKHERLTSYATEIIERLERFFS